MTEHAAATDAALVAVLSVRDPDAACLRLERTFGFAPAGPRRLAAGDQQILVVSRGTVPSDFIPMRIDHVAMCAPSADATFRSLSQSGARLDARFTPDGPRQIPEFRDHGVRFVFFEGPEGWPLEFCETIGASTAQRGHDHYGVRTGDIAAARRGLVETGAEPIAGYRLGENPNPVHVEFLALGRSVFELFDEAPFPAESRDEGWIGLVPR